MFSNSVRKENPFDLDASNILPWVAQIYVIKSFGVGNEAQNLNDVYIVILM